MAIWGPKNCPFAAVSPEMRGLECRTQRDSWAAWSQETGIFGFRELGRHVKSERSAISTVTPFNFRFGVANLCLSAWERHLVRLSLGTARLRARESSQQIDAPNATSNMCSFHASLSRYHTASRREMRIGEMNR